MSSANVERPTGSGPHHRIHPFRPPATGDRFGTKRNLAMALCCR
jgi:hypothetical protein